MSAGWPGLWSTAMSKTRLLPREQWVDDWVDTSLDEPLEDFKRDTQQRYRMIALWVSQ